MPAKSVVLYNLANEHWGIIDKSTSEIVDYVIIPEDAILKKDSSAILKIVKSYVSLEVNSFITYRERHLSISPLNPVRYFFNKIIKKSDDAEYVVEKFKRTTKQALINSTLARDSKLNDILDAIKKYVFADEFAVWIYNDFTGYYTVLESSFDVGDCACFKRERKHTLSRTFIKAKDGNNFVNHIDPQLKHQCTCSCTNLIKFYLSKEETPYEMEFLLCIYSNKENYKLREETVGDICELFHLKLSQLYLRYIDRWKDTTKHITQSYSPGKLKHFYSECVKTIVNQLGWEAASIFKSGSKYLRLASTYNTLNEFPQEEVKYELSADSLTVATAKSGDVGFSYHIHTAAGNTHIYDEPTALPPTNWVAVPIGEQSPAGVLRVKNKNESDKAVYFNSIDIDMLTNISKIIDYCQNIEKAFEYEKRQRKKELKQKEREYDYLHDTLRTFRHEIRSPMTVFTQAADLIKLELVRNGIIDNASELPEAVSLIFRDLKSTGDRLRFISHLLTFEPSALVERNETCLVYKEIVAPVLAFAKWHALKNRKPISDDRQSMGRLMGVKAYALAASIAFHVVVDNAIKYSNRDTRIEVNGRQDPDYSVIVVKNTGLDILEEEKERIFEKFNRGVIPKRRKTEGDGIGLALCRSIMEYFGGKVVLAQLKNPTIFELHFPIDREELYEDTLH
ncbi:MAG: hypothetical protein CL942_14375 [Desulfovibrio sp.]|nr:hypothetical protein [Desulfovibrio sp.]MBC18224.1 hypothetical protein [Desulfovibrio sp.]|tara:strand:- start:36800 stop:38836 length:2037 start_codon:yes stop_codon:yes gene_type:complete